MSFSQQILFEYVEALQCSNMNFEKKGRYIESVYIFLSKDYQVSRKGYRLFCRDNAMLLVERDYIKKAILHLLSTRGIGFRKIDNRKEDSKKNTLKKREVRQKQLIVDFICWLNREYDLSPNTLKVYLFTAKQFYSYCDELTQDNVKRYIATLEAENRSPKTINLRITGLEKLALFLKKSIKIKRPKIEKRLSIENIPSEHEYAKLVEWLEINNPKWAFIVRLMGTTGCRVSELVQFKYEQVSSGHCIMKGKFKSAAMGQFFTPMPLCKAMADVIPSEGEIVEDSACGSGRTLLAHHAHCDRTKFYWYRAADLDPLSVKMFALNMMINGMIGVVRHCDSLTDEVFHEYYINEIKYPIPNPACCIRSHTTTARHSDILSKTDSPRKNMQLELF